MNTWIKIAGTALVLSIGAAAAVWVHGAPRRELERYIATVVEPVRQVDDAQPSGEPVADCEGRVLPAYTRALIVARAVHPTDPTLAQWHARFVKMYADAHEELSAWVEASHAGDAAEADRAMMRFAHVRDDRLADDLASLCKDRGVTPVL